MFYKSYCGKTVRPLVKPVNMFFKPSTVDVSECSDILLRSV